MSYDPFTSQRGSPFGLTDPRSLYRSTQYEEVLARLRYGIEARKGFIVLTGDAGTGKSTLLQQLTGELSATVTCVPIVDPHLSFAEIIRFILLQLQVEPESSEEPALLRQCLTLLRSQAETGRILAVMFDDAHHLRDRVVEQVVRNFIVGPAAPRQYLAQIVLAGRPELKEQLFRPPPHTLASPAAVECHLRPLSEKEVGEYIEDRLRAADLPADLFEPGAIQRVAAYSGGKLRLVNALGDRAFPSADFSLQRHISPEVIDAAAKDLGLWQPRWVRKEAPEMSSTRPKEPDGREPGWIRRETPDMSFTKPKEPEERQPGWARREAPEMSFTRPKEPDERSDFGFADDNTEAVSQTFFNINDDTDRKRSRAGGNGRALRIFSILVLLGASAVWLEAEPARKYLAEWRATLGEIIGSYRQIPAPAKTRADIPPPATEELIASAPPSSANDPLPQDEKQKTSDLTYPEMEKLAELPAPVQPPVQQEAPSVKQPIPPPQKAPAQAVPGPRTPPREDPDQQRRELAAQVSKAIANRAIPGIGVSVIDGTAYLNGRVATERQRTAAERAAHAIPDVRAVQNRITIE